MTVAVVLLVLGSALAHATWNALLKRSRDPENTIVAMMGVAASVGQLQRGDNHQVAARVVGAQRLPLAGSLVEAEP